MKPHIATAIVDISTGSEHECTHYPEYSGRGMYGRKTDGVVVPDLLVFAYLVAQVVADLDDCNERQKFVDELARLQTDSMGRQVIVY